jgi:glycine cleavage system H protein
MGQPRAGVAARNVKWTPPVAGAVPKTPPELLYSKSHEWVRIQGDEATIGITDHAQEALNDIVYVELPKVGQSFAQEQEFGVVESVKSVSDLYMPVAGEVTAVNGALEDSPETLNDDPYGAGWLIKVRLKDPAQAKALLSAAAYEKETA